MAWSVVIDLVDVTDLVYKGIEIHKTAAGRSVFRCDLLSEDGLYRPDLDATLSVTKDAVLEFKGIITDAPEESPAGEIETPNKISITAADNSILAERQTANLTIPTGPLGDHLQALIDAGCLFGITLDPGQDPGPTIEGQVWTDLEVNKVLDAYTILAGGWPWTITKTDTLLVYEPGTVSTPFHIAAGNKLISGLKSKPTRDGYANIVIARNGSFRKTATDSAEVTAHKPQHAVITTSDDTPEDAVQALADAYLAQSTVMLKQASYFTWERGVEPGQTQTIDRADKDLNNTFLITDCVVRDYADLLGTEVTALEGSVYKPAGQWRETYRRWNGGPGTTVGGTVFGGGGGGSGLPVRMYVVGGNGSNAVQSPTPTWIPAAGGSIGYAAVRAQIDTTEIGTTLITIKLLMRALTAGVGVQARLYDITAAEEMTPYSATVTSLKWTPVVWSVNVNPGQHFYELHLKPTIANQGVLATGYVENI